MAWTTTKVAQYNAGDVVVQHWFLSADSATVELSTGLGNIRSAQFSPRSMTTTTTPKVKLNVLSAGTAAPGFVAITTAVSGDDIYLTVIGN
jgi:hypothetical protein